MFVFFFSEHEELCKTPKRKRNECSTEKGAGQSSLPPGKGVGLFTISPLHLLLSITPMSRSRHDNPPPFMPESQNNFSVYFIMGKAPGGNVAPCINST
jgi:hypothetical protein